MSTQILLWNEEIEFPEKTYSKVITIVNEFARKMNQKGQSTGHWEENRNARKPDYDNKSGKLGEFAAVWFLGIKMGFPSLVPDVEVRPSYQKKFDTDLPYATKLKKPEFPDCHVKTCSNITASHLTRLTADLQVEVIDKYSWTFQFGNKSGIGGRDKKIFDDKEDDTPIVFMYYPDPSSMKSILIATAPCYLLHEYDLFKEPVKPDLAGLKKCVYYKHLIDFCK